MPKVLVDGQPMSVSWAEYHAALLPKGTPVEWWDQAASLFRQVGGAHGTGVFRYSWLYDGVIAEIDLGHGKNRPLFLGRKGTRMKRLKDTNRLSGEGIHGDGI